MLTLAMMAVRRYVPSMNAKMPLKKIAEILDLNQPFIFVLQVQI